jgi:hypothetical protein
LYAFTRRFRRAESSRGGIVDRTGITSRLRDWVTMRLMSRSSRYSHPIGDSPARHRAPTAAPRLMTQPAVCPDIAAPEARLNESA